MSKEHRFNVQRIAKVTIATTVLALTALFMGACSKGGGTDTKDSLVAATVNGKNIMSAEVERGLSQQSGGRQAQLSQLELAQARLQILGSLDSTRSAVSTCRKRETAADGRPDLGDH